MPVHYAILKNTCWKNLCRTDLSSKKWLINLDHYSIIHGGIDESGRKSWSGMSSTSIIHFIVIIIIIIHCHHHSLSSSAPSQLLWQRSPSPPWGTFVSKASHSLLPDTGWWLGRWGEFHWSSLCESLWWVVKLHRVSFNVSSEGQRIFDKSKTSDDYLAHLYNSK